MDVEVAGRQPGLGACALVGLVGGVGRQSLWCGWCPSLG